MNHYNHPKAYNLTKEHTARRGSINECKKSGCKIKVSGVNPFCALHQIKHNKLNAKKAVGSNGRTYDSQLEKYVAADLELRKKAGEIKEIQEQFPIAHYVNGVKISKNIIDFKCEMENGEIWFVEAKGAETQKYRIDKALHIAMLDELYPGCRYFVVKGSVKHRVWNEIKLTRL